MHIGLPTSSRRRTQLYLEHGPINNRPDDMKANAKIAALNVKKVGGSTRLSITSNNAVCRGVFRVVVEKSHYNKRRAAFMR